MSKKSLNLLFLVMFLTGAFVIAVYAFIPVGAEASAPVSSIEHKINYNPPGDSQTTFAVIYQEPSPTPPVELVDPAPVPTAEVTSEPGGGVVVINNPAPTSNPTENAVNISTILYGVLIAILGGGSFALILGRVQKSKPILDAGEAVYNTQPEALRERERAAFEIVRDIALKALDIADKITDGKPNDLAENSEFQAAKASAQNAINAFNESAKREGGDPAKQ